MKKLMALAFLLLIAGMAFAYPKLTNYVNDFAGLLSQAEEDNLNGLVHNINLEYSVEIAIVTVDTTEGDGRVNYANRVGEVNGVGKKDKDNGIVILWSLDNEKGGAIATGRGIESILNDAKVTRIGRASRQYFDNQQYHRAFVFILNEIKTELEKAKNQGDSTATPIARQMPKIPNIVLIVGAILFVLLISGVIFGNSKGDYEPKTTSKSSGYKYVPIVIPPISRSSARDSEEDDDDDDYSVRSSSYVGHSSSSGGFSGFGGGSFGGGGGGF